MPAAIYSWNPAAPRMLLRHLARASSGAVKDRYYGFTTISDLLTNWFVRIANHRNRGIYLVVSETSFNVLLV